jgi:hypothetical protein
MELIAGPPAAGDDASDASCNPRAEREALERAHVLIANGAAQQILEHQYEIEALRPIVFENRAKAAAIRRLAELLPPGGETAPRLCQAIMDAMKPAD